MYQNVTEGTFMFFDKKVSKSQDPTYLGRGLRLPLPILLKARTLSFKKNHWESFITVKISRRTQKKDIYFAFEGFGLAFFSLDLRLIFGGHVGNENGVMLRAKRPNKLGFTYDVARIHSLMLYTDLIEYNIIGNTKFPLLLRVLFLSKPKAGNIRTTGQHMNHQSFSNLQIKPLFTNSFNGFHIDLISTRGEKLLVSVGINRLVFMFRKASNIHFKPKKRYNKINSREVESPLYRGFGRRLGFSALSQVVERKAIPFLCTYVVSAKKFVSEEMLELAALEFAEHVDGKKIFKTGAR